MNLIQNLYRLALAALAVLYILVVSPRYKTTITCINNHFIFQSKDVASWPIGTFCSELFTRWIDNILDQNIKMITIKFQFRILQLQPYHPSNDFWVGHWHIALDWNNKKVFLYSLHDHKTLNISGGWYAFYLGFFSTSCWFLVLVFPSCTFCLQASNH